MLGALSGCGGGSAGLLDGVEFPDEDEDDDDGGGGLIDAFDLTYPADFLFAEVGLALAPQVPVASTVVLSYSVEPDLPAGLELSPATGVLSGTATERAGLTTYLIVGTSAEGTAEFTLDLAVAGPAVYALVANRADDTISIFALGTDDATLQPAGYQLLSPFEVEPELLRAHPDREFVFATNGGSNTLSSIRVDLEQGTLESAHAISIGAGLHDLAVHPEGAFLYLTSKAGDSLRTYQFDPLGGTVAQIGDTLTVLDAPVAVQVAPNGRYVVLAHENGTLESFVIEPTSGQPIFAGELVLFEDVEPTKPAISLASDRLYVTLPEFSNVVQVDVDPESGFMTLGATRETEVDPSAVFLAADGGRAHVFNADSNVTGTPSVSVYVVDPITGAFGEPVHQELPFAPAAIDFAADGHSFVLLDSALPGPQRFEVDAETGLLGPGQASRARVDPGALLVLDGDAPLARRALNVYVANRALGDVSTFVVSAEDGLLSPLGPPTPGGASVSDLAVDPHRRFLWLANDTPGKQSVITYALLSEGLLAPVTERLFGVRPVGIAIDPSGRFAYVTTDDLVNAVFAFRIEEDGSLTTLEFHLVGNSPRAVEVDPTGQFLYVVNSGVEVDGDQGSIEAFGIDVLSGTLTPVPPPAFAGGQPLRLAFAPDGTRAYSAFANTDFASPYTIDAATGSITLQLVASETGNEPTDVTLSPDGHFAWVADRDTPGIGRVELFDVRPTDGALYDAGTGALEAREFYIGGNNPVALEVDPDGAVLYVLDQGSGSVTTFAIDSDDGELSLLDSDLTGALPAALEVSVGTP